jgi:hypothetical protein
MRHEQQGKIENPGFWPGEWNHYSYSTVILVDPGCCASRSTAYKPVCRAPFLREFFSPLRGREQVLESGCRWNGELGRVNRREITMGRPLRGRGRGANMFFVFMQVAVATT